MEFRFNEKNQAMCTINLMERNTIDVDFLFCTHVRSNMKYIRVKMNYDIASSKSKEDFLEMLTAAYKWALMNSRKASTVYYRFYPQDNITVFRADGSIEFSSITDNFLMGLAATQAKIIYPAKKIRSMSLVDQDSNSIIVEYSIEKYNDTNIVNGTMYLYNGTYRYEFTINIDDYEAFQNSLNRFKIWEIVLDGLTIKDFEPATDSFIVTINKIDIFELYRKEA